MLLLLPVLVSVAFLTLLERKVLSLVGSRVGPNKVSIAGFLQPVVDAVKLSNKQINSLMGFSFFFYYFSSFVMLTGLFVLWFTFMSPFSVFSFKYSLVILMLVLGSSSLGSILCGWSTFGKYSLIGSLRTVAQLISYEASLYLCFFIFLVLFASFSFTEWGPSLGLVGVLFPVCFFIWLPSFLAELNRTPYDFSEGESELVSGFNTEFGSKSFTFIFLTEYGMICFFSFLSSFMFFSAVSSPFFFFFFFFIIWIRSVLPRYRFDKLMSLAWKAFIPVLTLLFGSLLLFFN